MNQGLPHDGPSPSQDEAPARSPALGAAVGGGAALMGMFFMLAVLRLIAEGALTGHGRGLRGEDVLGWLIATVLVVWAAAWSGRKVAESLLDGSGSWLWHTLKGWALCSLALMAVILAGAALGHRFPISSLRSLNEFIRDYVLFAAILILPPSLAVGGWIRFLFRDRGRRPGQP